jgi:diguanylate cyclase (GGDEF)-like protein
LKIQAKWTLTLLFVGLASALIVGGVAYWSLMGYFSRTVEDEAFGNFQTDVVAYLTEHGSWVEAHKVETFHEFVTRTQAALSRETGRHPRGEPETLFARNNMAPFSFLLVDPQFRVVKPIRGYEVGQQIPVSERRDVRPIYVNGEVKLLALAKSNPLHTKQELAYLGALRHSLLMGISIALVLALLFGLLFGKRMSFALKELIRAVRYMGEDGALRQQVPVRSRDEIGSLAVAFNHMNQKLTQAHEDLRNSAEVVQAQADRLRELSIRDPLTRLYNRRHFEEQANTLYQQALRHEYPFSVMIADLDYFKSINDGFSHAVGDEVLRQVAGLLEEGTRKSDVLARYGGEEFVVAFSESALEQTIQRCEALRLSIETHPWHEVHPELRVTISIGVSDTVDLGSVEKMLAQGDERLYVAKDNGRNRVIPPIH